MQNTGTVKFSNAERAYALVRLDQGREVFVHLSWILGNPPNPLEVGQRVEYDVAPGRGGGKIPSSPPV